ncbi:MAG: ClbS/DfsB family four-helix bundle protein [Bacteroidota bacterium]
MPRPKSKSELLEASQANYQKLLDLVDSLPISLAKTDFPPGTMNRNVRDIFAHLHHWHLMILGWYKVGMKGEKPAMPAEGYTWKALPDLNRKIWEKYQDTDLETARELYQATHQQVHALIESHTDEELFEKKRYKWTGSTSLGACLISNTSSHYDWGIKLIRKAMKVLQA